MDRLFDAAQKGDVRSLHQLLAENPVILHQVPLICHENPLHFSSAAGHLEFTKEMLKLKPEFARQLNAEGHSAMHLASANGHTEIVKEMIKVDLLVCRLAGREGKTPLHLAVKYGKVDVICEMLANCEGCIEDMTIQKETALHIAVKNFQFGSLRVMVDWIRQMDKEQIVNKKDGRGNTILHLAVWKKQMQVLELLFEKSHGTLEVNAKNSSGLTALDLLFIFPSEAGDIEIHEILRAAGALKAQDLAVHVTTHSPSTNHPSVNQCTRNLIEYFRYHSGRDSPSDVRSTLLVIAVLVTTATYQVCISPPGGTWQETADGHVAGKSVMGTLDAVSYIMLVAFNSLGFNISVYMIAVLTSKFPLQTELQILLFAMYFTYNLSVIATSPGRTKVFSIVFTSILPTIVPVVANLLHTYELCTPFLRLFRRGRRN